MAHFLDIIIPEYNCPEEYIKRLLNSINIQKGVDFKEIGIIIVNDHSPKRLRKGIFRNYPKLNITYLIKETNDAQGVTRQYGMDRSEAKYVTFMDQDDMLFGNDNLSKTINVLKMENNDFLITDFVEEIKTGQLVLHKNETQAFLHGKFLKRQYLIDNNIRFSNELRHFEDTYFNNRLLLLTEGHCYYPAPTYFWRYNEQSQVRAIKYNYMVQYFDEFYLCMVLISNWVKNINEEIYKKFTYKALYGLVIILDSEYFDFVELKEKKEYWSNKVYEFYMGIKNELILDDSLRKEYTQSEADAMRIQMPNIRITSSLEEFMARLEKQK